MTFVGATHNALHISWARFLGFQMTAPHLRAAMEMDCTRISRGEDTKEAVVERCISKMKQCFQTCQAVRVVGAVVCRLLVAGLEFCILYDMHACAYGTSSCHGSSLADSDPSCRACRQCTVELFCGSTLLRK